MRVELAKLLLSRPDVLLLDEPTNHLDIESIQWLENFLMTKAKAVVLVSHDRAFIDNVTNRTIEISLGKIYDYSVNYSGNMSSCARNASSSRCAPMPTSRNRLPTPRSLSNGSDIRPPRPCRFRAA